MNSVSMILPAMASVVAVGGGAVAVGVGKARKSRAERGDGPRVRPTIVLAKSPVAFVPSAGPDVEIQPDDRGEAIAPARRPGFFARLFGRKRHVQTYEAAESVEMTGDAYPNDRDSARIDEAGCSQYVNDDKRVLPDADSVAKLLNGQEIRATGDGRLVLIVAESVPDVPSFGAAADVAEAVHVDALDAARAKEEEAIAADRARELEEIAARAEGEARAIAYTSQWWVRLSPTLDASDVAARKAMAGSLGRLRDDWAVDVVRLALTQEPEASVRARLIASLAKMEIFDDEPYLCMLTSTDEADRKAVLAVLKRLGTPWSNLLLETAK